MWRPIYLTTLHSIDTIDYCLQNINKYWPSIIYMLFWFFTSVVHHIFGLVYLEMKILLRQERYHKVYLFLCCGTGTVSDCFNKLPNEIKQYTDHKQHHITFRKYLYCIHEYIRVITKLPNSEQSYKGKVKTHNYIN